MNSLDKQARLELVENLRKIYLKDGASGEGISGGGSKAGARKNPYIQFLKEYKGVQKPHMAYQEHKRKYKLKGNGISGGAGTKAGAVKNNYIAYQKKYKGVKPKPPYNKNVNYSSSTTTAKKAKPMKKGSVYPHRRPVKRSGKKGLPQKLVMFNKCLERFRRDNPLVSYREAQKYVKQNINYNTGQCKGIPKIEYEVEGTLDPAQIGMGGVLDDYGGVLDDYGGVLDDYGGVLYDYGA